MIAASTHPFASWREQAPTPGERYRRFASMYQETVRRALVSGMHIHAGFGDERLAHPGHDRAQAVPAAAALPLRLLAVQRRARHRVQVLPPDHDGRPARAPGLPGPLHSRAEYERLVAEYQRMEYIGDARELWWDIRPASAFPTIELRICDVCTRLEDAVSIAALYASLIRWLLRHDRDGTLPPEAAHRVHRAGPLDRPALRRARPSSATGPSGSGRVDIDDYARRSWWNSSQTTPARSAARPSCATRSPSSRRAPGADRQIDLYRLRLPGGRQRGRGTAPRGGPGARGIEGRDSATTAG